MGSRIAEARHPPPTSPLARRPPALRPVSLSPGALVSAKPAVAGHDFGTMAVEDATRQPVRVAQVPAGRLQRKLTADQSPKLQVQPALNPPPCACVVFMHNDERKAKRTARLLHTNCRYNLAVIQDPDSLKSREIQIPQIGERDPNGLFPASIIDACMTDEQACRDFLTDKKTSKKGSEILGFAQRQYFLAIKDCTNNFQLPVVGLHNNVLSDTQKYRADMAAKGVSDLKLDVDMRQKLTGSDVIAQMRTLIQTKFGDVGVAQTLDKPRMTNIFRWCKSPDVERCHPGDPQHPDNVSWVTNPADFDLLKTKDVNVVLESPKAKPATSESAGDLSTAFVLLGLRLANEWSAKASVVKSIVEPRLLDEMANTLRPFLLMDPKEADPDAKAREDQILASAIAGMTQLADQFAKLRFVNIETEGKDWGKESARVANYRAIVTILKALGLHCCDVAGKGDAAVEGGLAGLDD